MSNVKFKRGTDSAITSSQKVDGQLLVGYKDNNKAVFYTDVAEGNTVERYEIGASDDSIVALKEKSVAESTHAEGTYLTYNHKIYIVIDDIDIGDLLVVDTNIELATIPDGAVVYSNDDPINSGGGGGGNASAIEATYDESTALYAHAVDDLILFDGGFYTVTSAIAVGDTITDTGNNANIDDADLDEGIIVFVKNIRPNVNGIYKIDSNGSPVSFGNDLNESSLSLGEIFIDSSGYISMDYSRIREEAQ